MCADKIGCLIKWLHTWLHTQPLLACTHVAVPVQTHRNTQAQQALTRPGRRLIFGCLIDAYAHVAHMFILILCTCLHTCLCAYFYIKIYLSGSNLVSMHRSKPTGIESMSSTYAHVCAHAYTSRHPGIECFNNSSRKDTSCLRGVHRRICIGVPHFLVYCNSN